MQSDLSFDANTTIGLPSEEAVKVNNQLSALQGTLPNWWEIGAAKYRKLREEGKTALPKPTLAPDALTLDIPSREAGRNIPCRLILPDGQERGQQKGVFYHIHGGGWTLMSEAAQDPLLKQFANGSGLAVLSVGYRLAPENPFPAGPEDCYDVAEHLVDRATDQYGAPLMFVGGESAGGHLSALVVFHLLQTRPAFRFRGTLLNYGCFNLSTPFPSRAHWRGSIVLTQEIMDAYFKAFVPDRTDQERADPAISPFYAPIFDLNSETQAGCGAEGLPPAFFACGTMDPLLDDTVFFAARWQMAGAEAITKIYRGQPHGFTLFPPSSLKASEECTRLQCEWMKSKV